MKEKSRQKRLRLLAEAKKKPAVFTVYVVLRLIVVAILVARRHITLVDQPHAHA